MTKPSESAKRILCIDDNEDTCEIVTLLLSGVGYEVTHALTVAEGLRLAKRSSFDLILLDWVFEDGDGLELCQMIRAFDANTPILFYSGVAYEAEIKRAMSAGAQGFLVKPLGTEHLVQAVSGFINHDPDKGPLVSSSS
jgi:DNA-binding response OmpR family regulator